MLEEEGRKRRTVLRDIGLEENPLKHFLRLYVVGTNRRTRTQLKVLRPQLIGTQVLGIRFHTGNGRSGQLYIVFIASRRTRSSKKIKEGFITNFPSVCIRIHCFRVPPACIHGWDSPTVAEFQAQKRELKSTKSRHTPAKRRR